MRRYGIRRGRTALRIANLTSFRGDVFVCVRARACRRRGRRLSPAGLAAREMRIPLPALFQADKQINT